MLDLIYDKHTTTHELHRFLVSRYWLNVRTYYNRTFRTWYVFWRLHVIHSDRRCYSNRISWCCCNFNFNEIVFFPFWLFFFSIWIGKFSNLFLLFFLCVIWSEKTDQTKMSEPQVKKSKTVSALDQLKTMTTIVADTGDFEGMCNVTNFKMKWLMMCFNPLALSCQWSLVFVSLFFFLFLSVFILRKRTKRTKLKYSIPFHSIWIHHTTTYHSMLFVCYFIFSLLACYQAIWFGIYSYKAYECVTRTGFFVVVKT